MQVFAEMDNYPKFLITLDDFTGDYDGIRQVNLIDWLSYGFSL